MPTIRRRRKNRRTLNYFDADWTDLVIGGPYTLGERTRLRPLWERHREQLMASINPGNRPAAFWEFEVEKKHRPGEPADPRKPGYVPDELQIDRLKRLGLLTPAEERLWEQEQPELEKTVLTPFQAPEPPARKKKASKPKRRPKPQVTAKAARSKDSKPSPAPEAVKEEAQKPKKVVWFHPAGGSGGSSSPLDEPWPEPFEGDPD